METKIQKNKKKYFSPTLEVIVIEKDTIIVTSGIWTNDGTHTIFSSDETF